MSSLIFPTRIIVDCDDCNAFTGLDDFWMVARIFLHHKLRDQWQLDSCQCTSNFQMVYKRSLIVGFGHFLCDSISLIPRLHESIWFPAVASRAAGSLFGSIRSNGRPWRHTTTTNCPWIWTWCSSQCWFDSRASWTTPRYWKVHVPGK